MMIVLHLNNKRHSAYGRDRKMFVPDQHEPLKLVNPSA